MGKTTLTVNLAYTLISEVNGSFSSEFAVKGLCHVPLSQNQPSKTYPSFIGFFGNEIISFPVVSIVLYISLSTTKFSFNCTFFPQPVRPIVKEITIIMDKVNKWTSPLNACFFVLSGAELEVGAFSNVVYILIGVTYIVFRSLGKYYGARLSSQFVGCNDNVKKYLGITLLPQAGVALGMCKQSAVLGAHPGTLIRNITLFSVLIYELVGPTLTKNALTSAGEIKDIKK